jgi:hypothetical protein
MEDAGFRPPAFCIRTWRFGGLDPGGKSPSCAAPGSTHAGWREAGPGLAGRVERGGLEAALAARMVGSLGPLGTGVPVHALLCRPLTSPPAGNVFQGFAAGLAHVWRPAEGSVRQTDKLGSLWRGLVRLSRSWDWSSVLHLSCLVKPCQIGTSRSPPPQHYGRGVPLRRRSLVLATAFAGYFDVVCSSCPVDKYCVLCIRMCKCSVVPRGGRRPLPFVGHGRLSPLRRALVAGEPEESEWISFVVEHVYFPPPPFCHPPPAARGRTACWRLEKTVGSDARLDYRAITKRFS